jgi:hypothetical protein
MATNETVVPPASFEFAEEFYEAYANNVYYEASSWDLKLIFGQLDQSEGKVKVVQHSAITVPWTQAKLMVYWLRGQIEAHELANGKVHMPPSLIPPPLPPLTAEMKKSDPNAEAVYAMFHRLREEFISSVKS